MIPLRLIQEVKNISAESKTRKELVRIQDFLDRIRQWMRDHSLLEVMTKPIRIGATNEPGIESFKVTGTHFSGWLQSSPELAMKTLLAQGSGDVFQITPAFRDDLNSSWHQSCFIMLEWYRLGMSMMDLIAETAEFMCFLHEYPWASVDIVYELEEQFGLNSHSTLKEYQACTRQLGLASTSASLNDCLDFLIDQIVRKMSKHNHWMVFYRYPPTQATLAEVDSKCALRFEWFLNGIELGHGYQELVNSAEQKKRFKQWSETRDELNMKQVDIDYEFLSCLDACSAMSGVAFGLDRLFSVLEKSKTCHWIQKA